MDPLEPPAPFASATTNPCCPAALNLALWLVAGACATLVVGWLAFAVLQSIQQAGLVPAVWPSVAVGLALGLALVAAARAIGLTLRWPAVAAAVVCALSAVVVQDVCAYRYYCRQYDEVQAGNRLAALARASSDVLKPPSFGEFLRARIRRDPLWWFLDAALTTTATVAVVTGEVARIGRTRGAGARANAADGA